MMLELRGRSAAGDLAAAPLSKRSDDFDAGKIWAFVRMFWLRRYRFVAVSIVLSLCLGVVYIKNTNPVFTSGVTIDVMNREAGFLRQQATVMETPVNMQREMLLAKSVALSEDVVRKLGLDQVAEFTQGGSLASRIRQAVYGAPGNPAEVRFKKAVDAVQRSLRVTASNGGTSFDINFTSSDPVRAADIANAIAEEFIVRRAKSEEAIYKKANDWMVDQSNELGQRALKAEAMVDEFKKTHNLVTVDGKSLSHQNLQDVNKQVEAAKAKVADAQYKLDKISASIENAAGSDILDATAAPEILEDKTLADMRSRYVDLINQANALQRNYNKDSPQLRYQILTVRGQILAELPRLRESARADLQIASKRYSDIAADLQKFSEASQNVDSLEVRLRQLQDTAQNYRNIYNSFLEHSASSVQEMSFPVRSAYISERATPPTDRSWPKTSVVLFLAGVGGLGLGVAGALLRDFSDRSFRTSADLEANTDLKCLGHVPAVRVTRDELVNSAFFTRNVAHLDGLSDIPIWWSLKIFPDSRFSAELNEICVSIRKYSALHHAQVIGVTSSVPGEGKSTLTASLAGALAQAGRSVAVLDCDYRFLTLTQALLPTAQAVQADSAGADKGDSVLVRDRLLNVTFVKRRFDRDGASPLKIFGSAEFQKLLEALRQSHEFVLVDLPPIVPVADVRASTLFIDGYVLAVEWAKTDRLLVSRALNSCPEVRAKTIGMVLNKVDFATLSKYDHVADLYYSNPDYARYRGVD